MICGSFTLLGFYLVRFVLFFFFFFLRFLGFDSFVIYGFSILGFGHGVVWDLDGFCSCAFV